MYKSFSERAADIFPFIVKADDSEQLVSGWIKEAADYIETITNYVADDPRKDLTTWIESDLSDMEICFLENNPDDDTDDTDFLDLTLIAQCLDDIVSRTIADIREDREDSNYFAYDDGVMDLAGMNYQYEAAKELDETDAPDLESYITQWLDEFAMDGARRVTEYEYRVLKDRENLRLL